MIGSELLAYGQRWIERNRSELEWLRDQGVSMEEAKQRHRVWIEQERNHPFWRR